MTILDDRIFIDENYWNSYWRNQFRKIKKRCARCLYDEQTPAIIFDEQGICNYCAKHDELSKQYPTDASGRAKFQTIVDRIKQFGRSKKYDVIIGVSGGCDSSYLLHLSYELGLRPLAVHFDNTWNSTVAVENIYNILAKMKGDLWTHVVDNEEYDDLRKAMLKAGVSDFDAPTDLGLAATLCMAAEKYKIKYIFEGHSFRTEGLSPLGWLYMDARYVNNIHQKYGTLKKLKTYPHLWLSRQLKWMLYNRFKKIRPLWYLDYNKEQAKKILTEQYGWQWYGGHHLENRISNFYHSYLLPRRFGIDSRTMGYSALVRTNQMTRCEGLELLAQAPKMDLDLLEFILKRLQINQDQFLKLMTQPKKNYTDFKTYKPIFERFRPFFYIMAKLELMPTSFYLKYTSKTNI